MKITPVGPVRTTRVARVRRAGEPNASQAAESYSPSSKKSIGDDVSIMGIPEAELTPKVRDALMALMAEVAAMRRELESTKQELASVAKFTHTKSQGIC